MNNLDVDLATGLEVRALPVRRSRDTLKVLAAAGSAAAGLEAGQPRQEGLMRVHIGSDHAGLDAKRFLVAALTERGHDVVDHGPYEYDALDDYPPFCLATGAGVATDPGSLGIVLGGSGNGEQIAANKVDGVRAALVWSEQIAQSGARAQRRQRHLDRRPHAHRGRGAGASSRCSSPRRSAVTTAMSGASASSPSTSEPARCRRPPERAG